MDYTDFFSNATGGQTPYPYQQRLAEWPQGWPALLRAPTGAGKTEAVVLAWLWRRQQPETTPRRLVYCLPMRTLVTQTEQRIGGWLERLELAGEIRLSILMGGETSEDEWRRYPEKPAIIVGTQDMLLSRALNRGYGQSPYQWPVDFGLLSNDCLWVLDEVQLMQTGLPTSVQLAAFRRDCGVYGPVHTLWMSATLRPDWLQTVDFPAPAEADILQLSNAEFNQGALGQRNRAVKRLRQFQPQQNASSGQPYNLREVSAAIAGQHQPGTLTLTVVNTVGRAQGVYRELTKLQPEAEVHLVHSRFRLHERQQLDSALGADIPPEGRIVVATQAVEAGVDIDARALFTDLAPWPSLVQRFGRCNRRGDYPQAEVYWLDLPNLSRQASPYDDAALETARERLLALEGHSVGPDSLPPLEEPVAHPAVLRRRDLLGLFDTTADLSGNYLDVSRFVRGGDDTDVSVFWREWGADEPPAGLPAPQRQELCSAPVGQLRDFLRGRANNRQRQAWRWDYLDREWQPVRAEDVRPGQTLLLRASDGGYSETLGWQPDSGPVAPVPAESAQPADSVDDDPTNTAQKRAVTLSQHSRHVRDEARAILEALSLPGLAEHREPVLTAAHWHDAGKAHQVFQSTMRDGLHPEDLEAYPAQVWAKTEGSHRYERPRFRHEVGSALALLHHAPPELAGWQRDLAAYLALAHHGKARLTLRSLPGRRGRHPDPDFLLGFRLDGTDTLPTTDLGDGVSFPETPLDLSLARIGVNSNGEPSWLERTLKLRDHPQLGPFRLAFLEALVRVADWRASAREQEEVTP